MMRGRRRNVPAGDEAPDDLKDLPVQWRRFIGYLTPYKWRLGVALLALIGSAGLSLVFPAVIGSVVDSIFDPVTGGETMLNQITLLLLGVFLLRSFTTMIESYNLNFIGERIVADVRLQLFRHLQSLSLGFFTSRRVGELMSRISNDVTVMRGVLTSNINTLLQQTLIMIGSIALMVILNWRLTGFIVIWVPILAAVGFGFGFYIRRISTRVQDEIASSNVVTEEVLQGIREVKSFAREPYEIGRYENEITKAFQSALALARVNAAFGALMAFLGFGSIALFLWFGGREVLEGRLSEGDLITFLFYAISVAGSFFSLVGLYTQFQQALGATKRVFQLLDTAPDVEDRANASALGRIEGRISFERVSFSYDGPTPVLQDIDLTIAPGEVIALVGRSGAGKSTMFNLIPRFYDPTAGTLRIDGIDAKTVTQASLRQQVGIVPQETMLFGGTIRENILYGRLDASEDDLIEAARAANAHDFITSLPQGYETIVGERGVRLSGGQRQRVAIARALLKDPRILLLDEATSSLDSESEHLVQEALARLMQNRTTVIIAHRLSTIRVADRIAVLDKGQIVELGTHEQLLAQGGLYAKLYEMQFREDEPQAIG
ncbi:MAG: ABC transporter transmembrane domain-containing protein [Anaerolineae bacterium]|nr:ABC transporter transmembrane domain-containing protein [Anaerolineae bacterium]